PDLDLAHLLADGRGRASERGGADGRAGAGEEATTGDTGWGCGRVFHQSRSFRSAFVGLPGSAPVQGTGSAHVGPTCRLRSRPAGPLETAGQGCIGGRGPVKARLRTTASLYPQ